MGSRQLAARFRFSWKSPRFAVPSPKVQTQMRSDPSCWNASAAPVAMPEAGAEIAGHPRDDVQIHGAGERHRAAFVVAACPFPEPAPRAAPSPRRASCRRPGGRGSARRWRRPGGGRRTRRPSRPLLPRSGTSADWRRTRLRPAHARAPSSRKGAAPRSSLSSPPAQASGDQPQLTRQAPRSRGRWLRRLAAHRALRSPPKHRPA